MLRSTSRLMITLFGQNISRLPLAFWIIGQHLGGMEFCLVDLSHYWGKQNMMIIS